MEKNINSVNQRKANDNNNNNYIFLMSERPNWPFLLESNLVLSVK